MTDLTVNNPNTLVTTANVGVVQNQSFQAPPPSNLQTSAATQAAPVLTLPKWGQITGDIQQQVDLQQEFALQAGIAQTNLIAHTSRVDNPHEVDKAQVGLDQVANLSPDNLPVSAATAAAIAAAVSLIPVAQGGTGATAPTGAKQNLVIPNQPTFRNLLDNAQMQIDQINLAAPITTATSIFGSFIIDRWQCSAAGGLTDTYQRTSANVPPGGFASLLITCPTSYAPASGAVSGIVQSQEAARCWQLGWGGILSNPSPLAVTIDVRASLPGTYPLSIRGPSATRSYVTPLVINAANTWETKTVIIPPDTNAAWNPGSSLNSYIQIGIYPVCGSTFQTATPNTWVNSNFVGIVGQTQLSSVAGATFQIGKVQAEASPYATPFEYLPYTIDLTRAQFFLQLITNRLNGECIGTGFFQSAAIFYFLVKLLPIRTQPVLISNGNVNLTTPTGGFVPTSLAIAAGGINNFFIAASVTGGPAANTSGYVTSASASTIVGFNAMI